MQTVKGLLDGFLPAGFPPSPNSCPVCGHDRCWYPATENGERIWKPYDTCEACDKKERDMALLQTYRENIVRVLEQCGVPPRYQTAEISSMQLSSLAQDAFMQVVRGSSAVLYGGVGCGKTQFACVALRQIIWSGLAAPDEAAFVIVPNLLGDMKQAMDDTGKVPENVLRAVIKKKVLILDDLGAEQTTEWARESVYRIINDRYNANLQTIVTTNHKPDSAGTMAQMLGRRITSRLMSWFCVHMGDKDFR